MGVSAILILGDFRSILILGDFSHLLNGLVQPMGELQISLNLFLEYL
jgi:hypothetical protein